MKADIDRLMEGRGYSTIVVTGPAHENLPLRYLGNGAKLTRGTLIKKRGETPLLLHQSMEREEAAHSGLPTADYNQFGYLDVLRETRDPFKATLALYQNAFSSLGVEGTVAFYGVGDVGQSYMLLRGLEESLSEIKVVGDTDTSLFTQAFATKDADELARMRSVAGRTTGVLGETLDFLRGHAVRDDRLVKPDGEPLTIGDVKRFVVVQAIQSELEVSEETIFAQGRDGGIPHSRGDDAAPVMVGQPIVFDFFPREAGGGYFHDVTRTICLGRASEEVEKAYAEVRECFDLVMGALRVGEAASSYQTMACEFFEERGHPTVKSTPDTQAGYVHSLGHGLGLELHGHPRLSGFTGNDVLEAGNVFTVEPGLYYPDRGFGIRIEDVVALDAGGKLETLTDFPKDLVIPVG